MSWRDAKRGGGGVAFPVAVASAALRGMPYGMRLGSVFKEINITLPRVTQTFGACLSLADAELEFARFNPQRI